MIGIDQEPNTEQLAALNHALGDGKYRLSFEQAEGFVRAIVRTNEQPPREVSTQFPPNIAREQIDATWQEFISRAKATLGQTELARSGPTASFEGAKPEVAAAPAPAPAPDEQAAAEVTQRDPVETDAELEGPHK